MTTMISPITTSPISLNILLHRAEASLATISTTARLDVELLLAEALKISRSQLYARLSDILPLHRLIEFDTLLQRRMAGEPMAYILGRREFWSFEFEVTEDTLIPRPETELLVQLALQKLPRNELLTIVDLGTGSGAIAISLANECERWSLHATEHMLPTLVVAQRNAQRLSVKNIAFYWGHWCHALPNTQFDAIISNPPYIAEDDPHLYQGDVRYEPRQAFVAGKQGLDALISIIKQAANYLTPGGWLMLEHGHDQGPAIMQLLQQQGYTNIESHQDLAGITRVVTGQCTNTISNLLKNPKFAANCE